MKKRTSHHSYGGRGEITDELVSMDGYVDCPQWSLANAVDNKCVSSTEGYEISYKTDTYGHYEITNIPKSSDGCGDSVMLDAMWAKSGTQLYRESGITFGDLAYAIYLAKGSKWDMWYEMIYNCTRCGSQCEKIGNEMIIRLGFEYGS
jgi:hypothetical protein